MQTSQPPGEWDLCEEPSFKKPDAQTGFYQGLCLTVIVSHRAHPSG